MARNASQPETSNMKGRFKTIGCANLCPDNRHQEFEHGAYCIANIARIDASLQKPIKGNEPCRIIDELEHLDEVFGKLSEKAARRLNEAARLQSFLDSLVELIQQLDEVPDLLTLDATVRENANS